MTLRFRETGAPTTSAELDAFERRAGLALPLRYRAFLEAHNGGRVAPAVFDIKGASSCGGSAIQYFLGFDDRYSIDEACSRLKDANDPRVPPEYLPIAECEGGDRLCIVVAGPKKGQIYFWDHEQEGYPEYTYENLYFVAEDIDALLAGLHELDVDAT